MSPGDNKGQLRTRSLTNNNSSKNNTEALCCVEMCECFDGVYPSFVRWTGDIDCCSRSMRLGECRQCHIVSIHRNTDFLKYLNE